MNAYEHHEDRAPNVTEDFKCYTKEQIGTPAMKAPAPPTRISGRNKEGKRLVLDRIPY